MVTEHLEAGDPPCQGCGVLELVEGSRRVPDEDVVQPRNADEGVVGGPASVGERRVDDLAEAGKTRMKSPRMRPKPSRTVPMCLWR